MIRTIAKAIAIDYSYSPDYLIRFGIVGLFGFGMPFEIRTVQHPSNFWPFKIWISLVFNPQLYTFFKIDMTSSWQTSPKLTPKATKNVKFGMIISPQTDTYKNANLATENLPSVDPNKTKNYLKLQTHRTCNYVICMSTLFDLKFDPLRGCSCKAILIIFKTFFLQPYGLE